MISFLQVHIPLSKEHKPIGLAYITFKHAHDAVRAYEEMDGGTFQGRLLHVLPAIDRKPAGAGPEESGKTLREMRLESKKKLATKGQGWEWGVLYMNVRALAFLLLCTPLTDATLDRRSRHLCCLSVRDIKN